MNVAAAETAATYEQSGALVAGGDYTLVAVVVGPAARGMRREVGAVAWCVLEALAASPTLHAGNADPSYVLASVRSLAGRLGVSKNTVHRALARLRAAGLVDQAQGRSVDGRYVAGAYRLSVACDVLSTAGACAAGSSEVSSQPGERDAHDATRSATSVADPSSSRRPRSRRPRPVVLEQLSLLPEV